MASILFNGRDKLFSQGQPVSKVMHRNALLWRVNPLAAHYGVGPGQTPIHYDLTDPAARTTGLDGTEQVVLAVANKGGSGAYHNLSAGSAATAPRFDQGGMLFRAGDLISFAHEAGLNGIHLVVALRLVVPSVDEYQAIAGHSGGGAGQAAEIQYWRHTATNRFRLLNKVTGWSAYHGNPPMGEWSIGELRYNWTDGNGTLQTRFNNGPPADQPFRQGGDLFVNLFGGGLFKGHLGGLISVIQDGGSISAPEPAVVTAKAVLAEQYGVAMP